MKTITAFLSVLAIAVASFAQPCSTNDACNDSNDCTTDICKSGACVHFDSDVWLQKADNLGGGRFGAVGFSIYGKGYIGTGTTSDGYRTGDFWEFDPATNSWTQKANFGGVRQYAVAFSIGNKGYMGTGYNEGYQRQNDFWEFDPAANTWTRKADFPGGGRRSAIGFSIGNKGYIGTGEGVSNPFLKNDFWEYDSATDTWTRMADFPGYPRFAAVGFSIGNKGYVGTGYIGAHSNDFWEYNPATNTWTRLADFPSTGRIGALGFSIGDKGYLGTSPPGFLYTNDFWEFDPAANLWTKMAELPAVARGGAVGFSIGNKGYIGTGYSALPSHESLSDFWEYNVNAPCAAEITPFTLINALTDGDIGSIHDDDVINLAALPTNKLNIRFETGMMSGSVAFKRNGQPVRTENSAPYAMAGDEPTGNYSIWTPAVGNYEVCATPHSGYGGTGIHGETVCVHFTVVRTSSSSKMSENDVNEPELNAGELQLYPNPNQGVFEIAYSSETITDLSVEVFDMFGKTVFREELLSFSGSYQRQLDLSAYPQGIYLLRVDDGQATTVRKVVISEK